MQLVRPIKLQNCSEKGEKKSSVPEKQITNSAIKYINLF